MNPTESQKKWFWEQCSIRFQILTEPETRWAYSDGTEGAWIYPDGSRHQDEPPIDLNFLFKYAVPFKNPYISFEREGDIVYCYGKYDEGEYPCGCPTELHLEASIEIDDMDYDKACALALFWAIFSAFGGKT